MNGWKLFCSEVIREKSTDALIKLARENFDKYGVYADSFNDDRGTSFFIAKTQNVKSLIIMGEVGLYNFAGVETEASGQRVKICPLNTPNSVILREVFPFTAPVNHRGTEITIGLGDRLGLASPGHIQLVRDLPVFPVLAQQSIRELNLTGRTYDDVLAAASWAVFQEGYKKGFGADGDHLKTAEEVNLAIDTGFTMITLDCSEHIDNTAAALTDSEVDIKYLELSNEDRKAIEDKYLNKEFVCGGNYSIRLESQELRRIVLVYLKADRKSVV